MKDGTVAQANRVRLLCSVITKIARADLESHLQTHDCGISAIEHGVLRQLARGVNSMAEIARRMGIAPSTLVYVVDGLVERKLVRRDKDPKDRRREPVLLEKKGETLLAGVPELGADSLLVRSLKAMQESHRLELLTLLGEFAAGLPGAEQLDIERADIASRTRRDRTGRKS
jgi:DNA-binding MarR family transcriptional regulator